MPIYNNQTSADQINSVLTREDVLHPLLVLSIKITKTTHRRRRKGTLLFEVGEVTNSQIFVLNNARATSEVRIG